MKTCRWIWTAVAAMLVVSASGCGGGGGGSSNPANGLIDVTDENALTDALVVRFGEKLGQTVEGDLPTKTETGSEPVITPIAESRAATNGDTVNLDLQIDSASAIGSLLLKVVGADSFLALQLLDDTESKASISETLEIDIPSNISDGTFCVEIVAVDDQERVSEAEQTCIDVESTADDETAPAAFTADFLNDRAFYLNVIDASTGEQDSIRQLVFNRDGSGTVLFAPTQSNSFATEDANPISWMVTNEGLVEYTEFGSEGEELFVTLTPTTVGTDSASFTCSVTVDGEREFTCADSTMDAADVPLYAFLSNRTFEVEFEDIETWVFNADGTGSVRFAPNPDNGFAPNDVNNFHWQAVGNDRMTYTEFGGDGYDRNDTNCENDPNVDCSLNPTAVEVNFRSVSANSASFDLEANSEDGTFTGSGSMTTSDPQTETRSLVGSWQGKGSEFEGFPHIVTFFPDGDYMMGYICDSGSGVEFGNYTYDTDSGTLALSNVTETGPEGGCGFNDEGDGPNVTSASFPGNGDVRFGTTDGGSVTFEPAASEQRPGIVGLLALLEETSSPATVPRVVIAFLADGMYMLMDATSLESDPDCAGGGVEFGPYSYSTQTKDLNVGSPSVNENGGCGIDDDEADNRLRYISDTRLELVDTNNPNEGVELEKIW